jgi:hypothetical protein
VGICALFPTIPRFETQGRAGEMPEPPRLRVSGVIWRSNPEAHDERKGWNRIGGARLMNQELEAPPVDFEHGRMANTRLDPRCAPMLIRDIEGGLRVQADSIDDRLNDPMYVAKPGAPAMRLGVGIYVFESPVEHGASMETPGQTPPKSARRKDGKRRG